MPLQLSERAEEPTSAAKQASLDRWENEGGPSTSETMNTNRQWIVTADARRASLFACERLTTGGLKVELVKTLQNAHEAEHERGRPTLAGGAERRGSVASSGACGSPHTVACGHTVEEEQCRFAREVASWLADARTGLNAHPVAVFSPARFLGLLRNELPAGGLTELHEAELVHLQPNQLAAHPTVRDALALA